MQTGNKQQAMILSGVAVLAIGFVIYQVLPKNSAASPAPAARAASAASAPAAAASAVPAIPTTPEPTSRITNALAQRAEVPDELSDELGATFDDPATHAASKPVPPAQKKAPTPISSTPISSFPPSQTDVPSQERNMPMPPVLVNDGKGLPAPGSPEPSKANSPEAPAKSSAPKKAEPVGLTSVTLEATISSRRKQLAVLKVGDAELTVPLGGAVGARWTLEQISDDGVVLRSVATSPKEAPRRRTLALGAEAKL